MLFHPINQSKSFKTILHSNLLQVDCKSDRIQFLIFNFAHQDSIFHSHFLSQSLHSPLYHIGTPMATSQVFTHIISKIQDSIELRNHSIILTFKSADLKEPFVLQIPLQQTKLTPKESIQYIKQFSKAKQEFYRSEILRLKTKIYALMTDLEDATNLIRAHSLQTKNSKEQIKNLKKQLKLLQDEKIKQKEISLIEVGVQHENSSQKNDIIEWLECPEVKQFSLDEQKLQNLTSLIENQIRENEKIINLSNCVLPDDQISALKPLSQKVIPSEYEQKEKQYFMIQIYEWDVIDMKMKEHLSKDHFKLYNKVKHSRALSHQPHSSSNQNFPKSNPHKIHDLKSKFYDQKNSRIKQRPCIWLKSKQKIQILPPKKNPAQLCISQILAIKQYNLAIKEGKQKSPLKHQIQRLDHSKQSKPNRLKICRKTFSQLKSIKRHENTKSSQKKDSSLTKKQKNKKYSVLSTVMTVTKVNLAGKTTPKSQNKSLEMKNSMTTRGNNETVSSRSRKQSDQEKKKWEQSMEFKSLSSRPKTADFLCKQLNQKVKNFLDLTGVQKKPLRL